MNDSKNRDLLEWFKRFAYDKSLNVNISGSTGTSSVNITQLNSTTIATNTGSSDAGTIRVALATDGNTTQGNIAHDAVDSGNPIKIGGKAYTTDPTPVATGDRVDAMYTKLGKQVIMPYSIPENFVSGTTASIVNTNDTEVIAAQGAGVKLYITQITVTNASSTVSTWVNIKDGSSTKYSVYAVSNGGGVSITLPVPIVLTANTALNAACETTSSDVRVSASGYKGV